MFGGSKSRLGGAWHRRARLLKSRRRAASRLQDNLLNNQAGLFSLTSTGKYSGSNYWEAWDVLFRLYCRNLTTILSRVLIHYQQRGRSKIRVVHSRGLCVISVFDKCFQSYVWCLTTAPEDVNSSIMWIYSNPCVLYGNPPPTAPLCVGSCAYENQMFSQEQKKKKKKKEKVKRAKKWAPS